MLSQFEPNTLYLTLDYILNKGGENKYRWGLFVTDNSTSRNTLYYATNVDRRTKGILNYYYYENCTVSDPTSSRTMVVVLKICTLSATAARDMAGYIHQVEPFAKKAQPPANEYQWTSRVWVKYVLKELNNKKVIRLPSNTNLIEDQALFTANLNINCKGRAKVFDEVRNWLSDNYG